jgi:hypothetical protein
VLKTRELLAGLTTERTKLNGLIFALVAVLWGCALVIVWICLSWWAVLEVTNKGTKRVVDTPHNPHGMIIIIINVYCIESR